MPAVTPRYGYRPDPIHMRPGMLHPDRFSLALNVDEDGITFKRPCPTQATNSCTGFGTKSAMEALCDEAGIPCPDLSGAFPYFNGRAGEVGTSSVVDGGAIPAFVIDGIQRHGICAEVDCPDDPDTVNDQPGERAYVDAFPATVTGVFALDPSSADFGARVRAALSARHPIGVALQVGEEFENYRGVGAIVFDAPPVSKGGHWPLAGRWRRRANGLYEYMLRNSWGEGWGERGYAWISESYMRSASDVRVYTIASKAPVTP